MRKYLLAAAGPLLVLVILVAALIMLHHELRQYHLRDFLDGLAAIPAARVWLAVILTLLNYVILIGYDMLGVRYVGQSLHVAKVALGSLLGYAVGNNFGTLLGGSTIRYRLYSSWGLSGVDIVKLVLIIGLSFWIGVFGLAGFVFLWEPLPIPTQLHLPMSTTRPLGVVLMGLALSYLALCTFRRRPIRIGNWDFKPPSVTLSLLQYLVATLDLLVAAAVLYVLLPDSVATSYWQFLAIYLLALVAAFVSQVPGGLGVLELVILAVLDPAEPHAVMGALLAYRAIYYLGPLLLGLLVLGGHEVWLQRKSSPRAWEAVGNWAAVIAPRMMAFMVFLAGVVLLFSGATPAAAGRMAILRRLFPLPVIEVSHFFGSLIGVMLLVLARGLQRRVETAYYVTIGLLAGGIVTSLLKGFDYEEALILGTMLIVFLPCRPYFYRQGALLTQAFTPGWTIGILGVVACTTWLMLFAYKHVNYQDQLWWQFEFSRDAPRSLRALAGAAIVTMVFLTARVLRTQGRLGAMPSERDLQDALQIVRTSPRTASHLALLGDKRFFFNHDRTAFVMYGEEGRSYVSMGDPVGSQDAGRELAWDFRELCDVEGRLPVFYQVDEEHVANYVEMGLTLLKIGEEARVRLVDFGLEGSARKNLRRTHKQFTEAGCELEIIEPPAVTALLPTLKDISDAWLGDKTTAEKGFSLGFFKPDYLEQCAIGLIRVDGQVVAFANLWQGAGGEELSIDLMRFLPAAPHGVMEFLFIQLMLWGKEQGYQWFNLGMAPLAGIESQRRGRLWNQIAALTFRHGEHFYHFQGLRAYKEKFHPVWTAKFIAAPGGWSLPVAIANVTTLISGGLAGILKK